MLWLYCLPGRILAQLDYLFPEGKGTSAGTRRRKDSKFAHFVRSTAFYLLTFIVVSAFLSHKRHQRTDESPKLEKLQSFRTPDKPANRNAGVDGGALTTEKAANSDDGKGSPSETSAPLTDSAEPIDETTISSNPQPNSTAN